ncbi:tyrosine-type recombinase/integrase [Streptomyces hydrogenans]|uniref:tyrosine-type recombinase/integrase n=1 Tax=Streptomyces hydrogenans TaxID=1873719 RepID=UPI0037F96383
MPNLAGAWVAAKPSVKTQESRAKGLLRWDVYCRSTGTHPLEARLALAEAYSRHLEKQAVQRGKNKGKPLSDATRANLISQASSFHTYAVQQENADRNPFAGVDRPYIDPDYSDTEGLTKVEQELLNETARERSPRAYAIVLFLYLLFPRVNEMLALNVEDIGYDRGHRTVPLTRKGGGKEKVPLPPVLLDALLAYLSGRTTGPLFATRTGRRMIETEIWKLLRSLARVADLPQQHTIKPHAERHTGITDALEIPNVKLQDVQDAAGHKSPRTTQRYNRRRKSLDRHPAYQLAAGLSRPHDDEEEARHE